MAELPEWASWATQATFDPYVDGHLEITNAYQRYIYYGKIASITLDAGQLRVELEWDAVGVDKHNRRSRQHSGGWVATGRTEYQATIFFVPGPEIKDSHTRVYFTKISGDEPPLQLFGGPIFEDILTFYLPGMPERVTPEEVRPADPANPVNENPRYIKGPPGGGTAIWDVGPDGEQFKVTR